MHKDSDFNFYTNIIKYEKYLREYVACEIPAVHRDLKIHLLDECYSLIRNLLEAQFNKGNIRMKYITEMLVNISMLDIISSNLYELLNNRKKQVEKSISMLSSIKNMTYAWRSNPEPNEKK